MQTIPVMDEDGAVQCVPVVTAFDKQGHAVPGTAHVEPEACDHKGASWSADLDIRCPKCGMRLFLPPQYLANQPEDRITEMYCMWRAAGCPEWGGLDWLCVPEFWTVLKRPGFEALGGLPVSRRKLEAFLQEFPG